MRKKDQNTRCHECQNWREKQLSNSVDSKPGRTHTAARLYQQKIWWPSRLRLAGSVLASTLPSSSVWSFRRWAKAWVSWWFFMPEIDLNTFEAFCNSKTLRVTWYLVVEEMVPSVGSFPRWTKFSTLAHPLRYFPPPPNFLEKEEEKKVEKKKDDRKGRTMADYCFFKSIRLQFCLSVQEMTSPEWQGGVRVIKAKRSLQFSLRWQVQRSSRWIGGASKWNRRVANIK